MRNFKNKQKIVQASGTLKIASIVMMLFWGTALVGSVILLMTGVADTDWKFIIYNMPEGACEVMAWWNFWIFFRRLNNGHIFDAATVSRLAAAGKWKLGAWIYWIPVSLMIEQPLHYTSWFNKLSSPMGPIAIIFAAWLLREAQNLEEEQELTV
jgi:hypothetical protein